MGKPAKDTAEIEALLALAIEMFGDFTGSGKSDSWHTTARRVFGYVACEMGHTHYMVAKAMGTNTQGVRYHKRKTQALLDKGTPAMGLLVSAFMLEALPDA